MRKQKVLILTMLLLLLYIIIPVKEVFASDESTEYPPVIIEGVQYTLWPGSNWGEATIPTINVPKEEQRDELYVYKKLEYKGITYDILSFSWDEDDSERENGHYDFWFDNNYKKETEYYHKNLKKITIADGLKIYGRAIKYYALENIVFEGSASFGQCYFYKCPKLKEVVIPKDMKPSPIYNHKLNIKECPNAKIIVDSDNPYLKVVNNDIYSKDGTILYNVTGGPEKYRVKKGVKRIAVEAFNGNHQIKSIYFPNSVKKIETGACSFMKNLQSVRISKSMKKTPWMFLRNSKKIRTLDLPSNIKTIGGAFGAAYGSKNCKLKIIKIRTNNLKKSVLGSLPKSCVIYVKNSKVKEQVRRYDFHGRIVIDRKL